MYRTIEEMPFRLTTREVAAVLRISVAAFSNRRRTGRYQIEPVERGQENLFDRRDVLRLLGRTEGEVDTSPPAPDPDLPIWGENDPAAYRAAYARQRGTFKPRRGRPA